MVLCPGVEPVATPLALIPATEGADEVHETPAVSGCVLPSLKMPLTVNCVVVPLAMDTVAGVMKMDSATAVVTKMVVVFVKPPACAVIVTALPPLSATPVTRPVLGSTEARVESDELHVPFVMVCVVPSLKVPVSSS